MPTGATILRRTAYPGGINPNDPGPAGGEARYRRYWRWAEPDESFGVSGHRITSIVQTTKASIGRTAGPFVAQGNNAGNNDELARSTRAAVNVSDGRRQRPLLKDSVNVVTLRGLVTLNGGEVISADQY